MLVLGIELAIVNLRNNGIEVDSDFHADSYWILVVDAVLEMYSDAWPRVMLYATISDTAAGCDGKSGCARNVGVLCYRVRYDVLPEIRR